MGVFVIVGVFVAIALVITIANAKEIKNKKAKAEAEKAMKLLDEKDEFKKFLDYDSTSSSNTQRTPQRPAPMPSQPQQSSQYRSQPAKQQMTVQLHQRLEELKRAQAQRQSEKTGNVVTSSHHDSHCDVKHQDRNERYRVEYVPTMNSIGGKSTEGCEDHYNVRYVKLDSEQDRIKELTPLQKAIVYGEVINQPAFKRGYRGRR